MTYVVRPFAFDYSGTLAFNPGPALLTVAVIECAPIEGGEYCQVVSETSKEILLRRK